MLHVLEPERLGARGRDRGHLSGHVREDDLAARRHARRSGQPGAAGPARQLEHALARLGPRAVEHRLP